MSKKPEQPPAFARGMFSRRSAKTQSGQLALSRARVIRADGTKDRIEYSVPRVAWWNLMGFVWRFKSLVRYLKEDRKWRQQ